MRRISVLCILLTTILLVSQGEIRTIVRLTYTDPFSPYQAIMPGQLSSALKAYKCPLPMTQPIAADMEFCQFTPDSGPFGSIVVVYNTIVQRVAFIVQPNRLYLSDLTQCWGRVARIQSDNDAPEMGLVDVVWGSRLYAVIDTTKTHFRGRLSYLLPISYIEVENDGVSCGSS